MKIVSEKKLSCNRKACQLRTLMTLWNMFWFFDLSDSAVCVVCQSWTMNAFTCSKHVWIRSWLKTFGDHRKPHFTTRLWKSPLKITNLQPTIESPWNQRAPHGTTPVRSSCPEQKISFVLQRILRIRLQPQTESIWIHWIQWIMQGFNGHFLVPNHINQIILSSGNQNMPSHRWP